MRNSGGAILCTTYGLDGVLQVLDGLDGESTIRHRLTGFGHVSALSVGVVLLLDFGFGSLDVTVVESGLDAGAVLLDVLRATGRLHTRAEADFAVDVLAVRRVGLGSGPEA